MPFSIRNEVDFWGRQMSEHALFLSMLLTDEALKNEAAQFHRQWEQIRASLASTPDNAIQMLIAQPLADLIAYKERVFNRLLTGEFLGFAYPLFLQHVLTEALFLQKRALGQGTSDYETVYTSLRLSGDHAKFAAHLLDPTEAALVDQADQTGNEIYQLMTNGLSPPMLSQAAQATNGLGEWLVQNRVGAGQPRPLSIIPDVLANHVVREQQRFTQMITEVSAKPTNMQYR